MHVYVAHPYGGAKEASDGLSLVLCDLRPFI